jgi:DNA-binding NarL/FixJ family response regulator
MLEKLRVLVAEDHESIRGILVGLLRPEFEIVAAVDDGANLVRATILFKPDVIVSDILMPVQDGLSARTELQSRGVEIPFVFVTLLDVRQISPVPATISYVHKSDVTAELVEGVRAVARGETYLSRSFRELWGNS